MILEQYVSTRLKNPIAGERGSTKRVHVYVGMGGATVGSEGAQGGSHRPSPRAAATTRHRLRLATRNRKRSVRHRLPASHPPEGRARLSGVPQHSQSCPEPGNPGEQFRPPATIQGAHVFAC
jgi:hypothetical protein